MSNPEGSLATINRYLRDHSLVLKVRNLTERLLNHEGDPNELHIMRLFKEGQLDDLISYGVFDLPTAINFFALGLTTETDSAATEGRARFQIVRMRPYKRTVTEASAPIRVHTTSYYQKRGETVAVQGDWGYPININGRVIYSQCEVFENSTDGIRGCGIKVGESVLDVYHYQGLEQGQMLQTIESLSHSGERIDKDLGSP